MQTPIPMLCNVPKALGLHWAFAPFPLGVTREGGMVGPSLGSFTPHRVLDGLSPHPPMETVAVQTQMSSQVPKPSSNPTMNLV